MKGIIFALLCAAWGIVSEAGVYRIKRNNIRPMGLPLRRASPASVILRAATETAEDHEEAKLPLPEELEDSLIIILMEGPNGFLQVLTIPMDELNEPIKGTEKGQPGRLERVRDAGQSSTQIRSLLGALKAQQPGQRVFLAKSDDAVEPVEEVKPVKASPLVIFLFQDSLEVPADEKPADTEGEEDLVMLVPIEQAAAEKPAKRWMPLQALGKRKRPVRTSLREPDDRLTAYLNSLRTTFSVRN